MNGEMCSVCHKRIATVFITQIDNQGQQVNRGLCLVCAKKMNLPQVTQFLDKMGISDEDLEKEKKSLIQENQELKQEVRNLKTSIEAVKLDEREITNVDLLKRISDLEKVVYGE